MNNREDARFIRNSINDDITLPDELSKESITALVSGEKQKGNKKGMLRRFIAAGVAACIVLSSGFLFSRLNREFPQTEVQDTVETTESDKSESYDELLSLIKSYGEKYSKNIYYYLTDDGSVATDYNTVVYNSAVSEESVMLKGSYGELNVRQQGVLEADIMITDGEYFYTVDMYAKRINIIKAEPDGTLTRVWSESSEDERDLYCFELYRYENYLIVCFTDTDYDNDRVKNQKCGAYIYDISDKAAPVLKKEIALDGRYVSSRISDGRLILISSYSIIDRYEGDDVYLLPGVYNGEIRSTVPCDCIYYEINDAAESYVNIMNADLNDLGNEAQVTSFLGRTADTYCTKDTLYTIGYEYKLCDDTVSNAVGVTGGVMIGIDTGITRITAIDISEGKAKVRNYTEFEGSILNSYAIDEYNGYLRVAVQKNQENCIYVFDKAFSRVSEITGIAEGERIKSARFMGDTAYLVTFLQTDPLFVIDMSDPEKPEIVGEVKIPGFSSYLHPVGDGLLVGVGHGGTLTGVDGSSKISLFDVSDPKNPKEIDSLVFPTSQLGTDPKAFCSVTENSFLLTYENWTVDEKYYEDEDLRAAYIHTGALYVAAENGRLVLKGSYLAKNLESVVRATFIGDNVYIFSDGLGCMASFDMKTGEMKFSLDGAKEAYKFTVPSLSTEEILY